MFDTLKDAQSWIESVKKFGDKYDLTRMQKACEMLGHPEISFKTIHIGGTNGKGSTLTFLKQMLMEAGYNVGTFTSPYVVSFNERIAINDAPIPNDALKHYIEEVYTLQASYKERYNDQITFFEMVTLISFLYFKASDVDVVLYEVGLGGTLDATNVISPVLSVITSVGYDHMHILGDTLESIAENKLGIVKDGVPLVSGVKDPVLLEQFRSHAKSKKSPVYFTKDYPLEHVDLGLPTVIVYRNERYNVSMLGMHQVENAHTALLAADILAKRDDFHLSLEAKKKGLEKAHLPGRFERFGNVILDGAHNISSLERSLEALRTYYPDATIRILFNVMKDKAYVPMLKRIETFADELYVTEIPYPRSEKADVLAEQSDHNNVHAFKDYREAYEHARPDGENAILYATGSLYFISALRRFMTS